MLYFGYRELLCRCLAMSPPILRDNGWRGQYTETDYGCPDHQNSFKQASRSDCRNRQVCRSMPDRTWPFTLPCLAHANRVRGAMRRYAEASLAVSQSGVCGTSGILETTGTAVELFNHFDCAGHYSLCGCLAPAKDLQCAGRLSPDTQPLCHATLAKYNRFNFQSRYFALAYFSRAW